MARYQTESQEAPSTRTGFRPAHQAPTVTTSTPAPRTAANTPSATSTAGAVVSAARGRRDTVVMFSEPPVGPRSAVVATTGKPYEGEGPGRGCPPRRGGEEVLGPRFLRP